MTSGDRSSDESPFDTYGQEVSQPLRRLFARYGRSERAWLAVGLLASILSHGAGLVTPFVLGTTIDAVFTGESAYTLPLVPGSWLPKSAPDQFRLSAALVGGSIVLAATTGWLRDFAMNYFAHGVMYEVRADAYRQLQRLDTGLLDEVETGEAMSILNNDTTNLERFFDTALRESARICIVTVGITALLVHLNWQLATITLLVVPLLAGFTWWFTRAVEPRFASWRSAVGSLNTRLQNAISGNHLVKTTAAEDHEAERIERAAQDLLDSAMGAISLSVFYRPGTRLLTGISLFVTFVVGGIWVINGPPGPFSDDLTVGTFVVFVLLTQRLTAPLAKLSDIVTRYENAKASGKRVCGLLDAPVRITDAPDATHLDDIDGRIEFDEVSFAYGADSVAPNEDRVFDGLSFTVESGETVALVGPTGAGKSTVAKLLLRLYDVTGGAVRIDGHDLRSVTLESLRTSIGYVGQESFLFDGTVTENIRYGQFDASDEAIRQAARAARAHEFIESLPQGYDTEVGERGVKLSGGQRQRIALARVFLQDPDVVLLDEATASVDTETELLIRQRLEELTTDRTTIAIAHRLSTIKNANRVLVVEDGRIVEGGTHDELLEDDGLYAALWQIQTGQVTELPERVERSVARNSVLPESSQSD
ncbi:ABC transporter ATP-binding protein [Halosimplex sp. J119]